MELTIELPNSALKIIYFGRDNFIRVNSTTVYESPSTCHTLDTDGMITLFKAHTVTKEDREFLSSLVDVLQDRKAREN